MKKILLTVLSAFVLLASCNNLHFDDSTSVSMYLPSLNNQNNSSQDARLIHLVDIGVGKTEYYNVELKQKGKTKYSLRSAGGRTVSFTNVAPGSYEVECSAFTNVRSKKLVFARGSAFVNVTSGKDNKVDLSIYETPIILSNGIYPVYFVANGSTDELILTCYVATYSLGYDRKSEVISNKDSIFKLYIDGIPYTPHSAYDKQSNGDPELEKVGNINSITACDFKYKPGKPDTYTYHDIYFEVTNIKTGLTERTDVVRSYFLPDVYNNDTVTLNSYDVQYKGFTNQYYVDDLKNVDLSDFNAQINCTYTAAGESPITLDLYFPDASRVNPTNYFSVNFELSHENGTYDDTNYTIFYEEPGLYKIPVYYRPLNSGKVKIKDFDFVAVFDFNLGLMEPGLNAGDFYYGEPGSSGSLGIPSAYQEVTLYLEVTAEPEEDCQWYFCDDHGNIIKAIPGANKIAMDSIQIDGLEPDTSYHVCCKLTYTFDTTYCTNASGGKVTIMTVPMILYNYGV